MASAPSAARGHGGAGALGHEVGISTVILKRWETIVLPQDSEPGFILILLMEQFPVVLIGDV